MNLFERVKGILLNPRAEWSVIEREQGDVSYLFTNYVAILAAIPAICRFIGDSLFGRGVPILTGLVLALVGYLLTFAIVYLVALIADLLAPTFGGRKDSESALKLMTYSYTPAWVSGVFFLIPSLGFLYILGVLYGFYVLWTGITPMMKSPREKAAFYTLAIIVCTVVIGLVLARFLIELAPMARI